jgi:hypothetical protein
MRVRNIVFFIVLLAIDACVDPLKVPDIPLADGIVVDGAITDQPGPYSVKIFSTQSLDSDLDRQNYIRGATVRIRDDHGNVTTLTENEKGIYVTTEESFRGTVGYTYQLFISLSDGRQYESSSVLLEPAGTISRVYFQFQENVINENVLSLPQDAFAIFIDARGTEDASNFFRWRWTGTFHYKTFPELRTKGDRDGVIPDPLPCSGYVYDGELYQVKPCECCDCWAPQYSTDAFISDNDFADEMTFNAVQIAQIPLDKRLFYEKYHIAVEQLSLSEDVYTFWKLVRAQQQGGTDIFQPSVVKIKGTIECTSNPAEKAYGIFTASAVVKSAIFITPSDIPKLYPSIDTLVADCRTIYPGATTTRPPFW